MDVVVVDVLEKKRIDFSSIVSFSSFPSIATHVVDVDVVVVLNEMKFKWVWTSYNKISINRCLRWCRRCWCCWSASRTKVSSYWSSNERITNNQTVRIYLVVLLVDLGKKEMDFETNSIKELCILRSCCLWRCRLCCCWCRCSLKSRTQSKQENQSMSITYELVEVVVGSPGQ